MSFSLQEFYAMPLGLFRHFIQMAVKDLEEQNKD